QMGARAAFQVHRDFVTGFLLPNIKLFGPLIFLAELMFAVSLILGLGVRFAGVIGIFFVLHLWLGIYLPADPAEWPWAYMFLAMLMFFFALHAAGRSLGLDAWLRRNVPSVREGKGAVGKVLNLAG
ncbi:MAG: DoxX family protein, partial [Pseudorhodoplanes sp.]|nr:DoxX family protein [Pseudorhodoplanes sp.]